MKELKEPVFIVGHPRSGSTLLASLLNEHSEIVALPETHFMDRTCARSIFRRVIEPFFPKLIVSQMYKKNLRTQDTGVSKTIFEDAFYKENGQTYKDAFHTLLQCCLKGSSRSRVLEKTPKHLEHIRQLLKWFPDAKIICIIRDGRDAVDSLMNAPWTHSCAPKHAAYWAWCVRKALIYKAQYPGCFYLLRYEDLLLNPEKKLEEIFGFLGERFESGILLSERSGIVPDWERGWKENSTKKIDANNAYKWKKKVGSKLSASYPYIFMKDELILMGYDTMDGNVEYASFMDKFRWNKRVFALTHMAKYLLQRYLMPKTSSYRKNISNK